MQNKVCGSCGNENPSHNRYCTNCGAKFYEDSENYARLCLLVGEPRGAIFLLNKKRKNTIGRDGSNTIILADEQISNKHAVIRYDEPAYWIEDLNSKNGVYVDGRRISKTCRLADGSMIKIGSSALLIETTK